MWVGEAVQSNELDALDSPTCSATSRDGDTGRVPRDDDRLLVSFIVIDIV
jgi:hypothetical protein